MGGPLDFSARARPLLDFSGRGRAPTQYDTDDGPAWVQPTRDGTIWLETDGGRSGPLSSFANARPRFTASDDRSQGDGSTASPHVTPRTLGQRFTSTFDREARETLMQAGARSAMAAQDRPQVLIDERTGQPVRIGTFGADLAANERRSREDYDATTQGDEWYRAPGGMQARAVAGVATLAGAVAGTLTDPTNLIGIGGRTAVQKVAGEMAVNATSDASAQGLDMSAGVRDEFDPIQTGASGLLGGVIGGGAHVAPAAGRGVARAAGAALDFSNRAVAAGAESLSARVSNPVPGFDGPAMAAGRTPDAAPDTFGPSQRPTPTRAASGPEIAPPSGVLFSPPVAGRVSSGFGPRTRPNARASANHPGVDFAVPEGTPVAAAADGEVIFAGRRGNYGNRVVIRHADGSETAYSHLSGFGVKVGDRVQLGQSVARSGSTGNVTGPHLHFELRRDGAFVDPLSMLNGERAPAAGRPQAARQMPPERPDPEAPFPARPAAVDAGQPDPIARRYPNASPEEVALAREAILDPAAAARLRTLMGERMASPRETRNASRAMIQAARREAGPVVRQGEAPEPAVRAEEAPAGQPLDFSDRASPAPDSVGRVADAIPMQRAAPDFSARATSADRLAARGNGQPLQSGGQSVSGLREAPRPEGVARGQGEAFAGKTVSDLVKDLRQTLGLTHRQGRVSSRNALGEYDPNSGVIRTRAVQEMNVLAHEATHALEFEHKGPALAAALKMHGKHLETLAYPGAAMGVRREEGFAEFGRWYLTNPDHARRIAPDFFRDFEAAMAADAPEVLAGLQAVQGSYQNLLSSSSIDSAKAAIAYTGSKGPIGDLLEEVKRTGPGATLRRVVDDIYTAVIDDLHPLSIAERKLSALYMANRGQKIDLKRAASPYALARLSREAYAAGHSDLMRGVTPYHGLDPEGPSMADAMEVAGLGRGVGGKFKAGETREFDAYLISRRAIHLWDRYSAGDLPNPPDQNTRGFHEQVIKDAEAAHPTWDDAAALAYEFQNNLWKKEFDAGLITRDAYDNGLTHTDYVPFMRDMSDKGPGGAGGKPRGALQFAGGTKQLEGSNRAIISPLSSIMRRSYELNAIIKRNDTMVALDDLATAAGRGSGSIVERLPAHEVEVFTADAADALRKTADEMGLSGRDLSTMQKFADDAESSETMISLFKQTEFSPRKGEAVVFVWRDGKKTPLLLADGEFGQQMFSALAGMNRDLKNVVVESMAAATQLLRYGVTLSPEFMAANIIRDSLATWINTDVGFVPVLDTIRGGAMEVAQGKAAARYAAAGGMRGGANVAATSKPFPRTDAEAEAQLQHLRRKGWKVKRYASWRGLAELTDLSETATRMGVFAKAFEQAKRQGLSDYEALIESGFISRDYLDFARRGSKMVTASRVVTFLNAAIQGTDKSMRVMTSGGNLRRVLLPLTKEARTPAEKRALTHAYKAWAKVSVLGAFGLGLRMLYADDAEYQEINDRLRATHWIARVGGKWVFVPKPFELATVSNILERAYEGTALDDPRAGERLLSDFRHTIAPPSEIPALSVPFNIASNRDYLGRPIVPDHLRGTVDPELQFNSYTSDLGKLIGRTFKVSPAVADYVVTGFGGSIGRYILQGGNLVGEAITGRPRTASGPEDMFLARRFVRSIARGADSQSGFWDSVSRDGGTMTRAEGSFRSFVREANDAEGVAYLNRLPADQRAYVVAKVFSGSGESAIHPLVRTQKEVSVIGDFRSDMRNGTLRDDQGRVIDLTPQQRRAVDNAIGDFALAEMRNAMIDTGVRGWAQRERMDPTPPLRRIYDASPAVMAQLSARLANERVATAVHPLEQQRMQEEWRRARPILEGEAPADALIGMMRQKRGESGGRGARYEEAQRRAGGAYDPTDEQEDYQPRNALRTGGPRMALPTGNALVP